MRIDTIVVGPFEVNCYVLSGADGQCIVVDPGADAQTVEGRIREQGYAVSLYMLTHGHVDHVSAVAVLHDRHPAPVGLHPADRAWAFDPASAMPPFYSDVVAPDAEFLDLVEGATGTHAGLTWEIIETPGHTPGGVCVHFPGDKTLLSGDTLFAGSVGRTDLQGGSSRVLAASLKKLQSLPDDTRIYAGHGPATTLGQEKATNFFMR